MVPPRHLRRHRGWREKIQGPPCPILHVKSQEFQLPAGERRDISVLFVALLLGQRWVITRSQHVIPVVRQELQSVLMSNFNSNNRAGIRKGIASISKP